MPYHGTSRHSECLPALFCCGLLGWVVMTVEQARRLEQEADQAAVAQDYAVAEAKYREAAEQVSSFDRPKVYLKLGRMLRDQGRLPELPALYQEGVRESKGDKLADLYCELILSQAALEQWDAAATAWQEYKGLSPRPPLSTEQRAKIAAIGNLHVAPVP